MTTYHRPPVLGATRAPLIAMSSLAGFGLRHLFMKHDCCTCVQRCVANESHHIPTREIGWLLGLQSVRSGCGISKQGATSTYLEFGIANEARYIVKLEIQWRLQLQIVNAAQHDEQSCLHTCSDTAYNLFSKASSFIGLLGQDSWASRVVTCSKGERGVLCSSSRLAFNRATIAESV